MVTTGIDAATLVYLVVKVHAVALVCHEGVHGVALGFEGFPTIYFVLGVQLECGCLLQGAEELHV